METQVPAYDSAAAATLLDGLGWTDGGDTDDVREQPPGTNIELTLIAPSGKPRVEALCTIIAEEAASVGISITVELLGTTAFTDALYNPPLDWEMACVGVESVLDPALLDSLIPSYGTNHLSEPEKAAPGPQTWEIDADAAWQTVMETPDDFTSGESSTRYTSLQTIQQIWADYAPWIYLSAPNIYEAYRVDLKNVFEADPDVLHPFDGYGWNALAARLYFD
jgi:ABC-type transport system substrate-binding protein